MSRCPVKRQLVLIDKDVALGTVLACREEMANGLIGMNVKRAGNCESLIIQHHHGSVQYGSVQNYVFLWGDFFIL